MHIFRTNFFLLVSLFMFGTVMPSHSQLIGQFEKAQDVGTVLHAGTVSYDPASKTYKVSGSGENMWGAKDSLHYVWKKASGDISIASSIKFSTEGKEAHRKGCLMIRQSLDDDSAYVDVAVHGDGLTSLQFRESKGGRTHEVQSNVSKPSRVKLERRGKYVVLHVAENGGPLNFSGAAERITFEEPFYIGIGVCAHNKDAVETAEFSNVEIKTSVPGEQRQKITYSTLETQTIASTDRRVCYVTTNKIEAPNWLPGGKTLLFNSKGLIHTIPAAGGSPTKVDTGFAIRCNNDHGISPDGKELVISDQSQGDKKSVIYILPLAGGTPRKITEKSPSYWHGWSPDGKTLAYCAERGGEFDIYTISVNGGIETRLTTAVGLDDGPEYSPDGKYIYFNSERTGKMQIWRMKPDGSDQEQVTKDDLNNWFAHLSPDGKLFVYITFSADVKGHPENKDVTLRMMNLATGVVTELAHLFGGQGTANVPCWSPDSKKIAFVTYQILD